ncbi:MAG TPA: PilZ domain-containing protein [Dongiaceae bacterium]
MDLNSELDRRATPRSDRDRRIAPRRRVLKSAKILFNEDVSVFDCIIRDISESGARLSLGLFQPLPKRFKLVVSDLGIHVCELVRSIGNDYGVRFVTLSAGDNLADIQAA